MTLKEILSRMQPSDYVKIGTEFGSTFLFAGTVEAVLAKIGTEKTISGLLRQNETRKKTSERTFAEQVKKWEASAKTPQDRGWFNQSKTNYERVKHACENFKPPIDREVLDAFRANPIIDDVPDVLVLNIEGVEHGTVTKIDKDGNGVAMK